MGRSGWGHIALVLVVSLAACSQRPPSEPTASSAGTAAPPPPAAPLLDAPAAPPADAAAVAAAAAAAPCLPPGVAPTVALDAGEAQLCWPFDNADDLPDACLWMSAVGAARRGPPPAAAPAPAFSRVTVLAADQQPVRDGDGPGSSVEVCVADGACRTIAPRGGTDAVTRAVLDAAGARVAILLQADPLDGGNVEVHDARTGKRHAGGRMAWDDHHGVSYRIAWVGRWLLWVELPGATAGANGALYKVSGSKLATAARIDGRVYDHAVAARHAVFVGTALAAEVHDLATGRRARTIDLAGLHAAGPDADWEENEGLGPSVAVDGDAAVFWLDVDGRMRLAFASLAGGAATFVDVPRCPAAAPPATPAAP